jgi:hypothetical protein
MRIPAGKDGSALLARAHMRLGGSQEKLGKLFGVSRRTIIRWYGGGIATGPEGWTRLVAALHAKDPVFAASLASELGETLVTLGLEAPPPVVTAPAAPTVSPKDLADLVVLAAAEAAGLAPHVMRPALVAAFDKAAAVRMEVEDVRKGLAR